MSQEFNAPNQVLFYCQKLGGCMPESNQIIDASAAIATGKIVGYTGSGVAGVSAWMGTIDLGFWISIGLALAGFAMNWYFARKKDKRDELKHKAYIASLEIKGRMDE